MTSETIFCNKTKEKIPHRATIKYILLQLPAFFIILTILIWLYYFSVVSLSVVILILVIWILKDFILFFYVWRAYDIPKTMPVADRGITVEDLNPEGYIQVGSELWRATVDDQQNHIKKGQQVNITGHKGLTLVVRREVNNEK